MDSGNSGSLQSSSGGDVEYDAHYFLLNTHSPPHLRPLSRPPPPLFNPLSNNTQPASMRSDPNQPTIFQARPRKRSRASRRPPTAVLTTDTTNFRAMVQEFTGISAPPFNSSSFLRNRLNLFGPRSTGSEAALPPPPPYLRLSSTASCVATVPINYQLPITLNSNLFNVQNPYTPTSLLQSYPRFLFPSSEAIASKPHEQDWFGIPTTSVFDDSGSSLQESETLHELPNLFSPHQTGAKERSE